MLVDLVAGRRPTVWSMRSAWQVDPPLKSVGLLSGAFNPLHDGHRELARVAEQRVGGPLAFELAWVNVDKPPLDFLTIEARCRQFADRPVVLTREPTFVLKSRLFPNTTFVVGVDTAERIVQPRYYGSESAMLAALAEIRTHGCRFLVAGRSEGDSFRTLSQLNLPSSAQTCLRKSLKESSVATSHPRNCENRIRSDHTPPGQKNTGGKSARVVNRLLMKSRQAISWPASLLLPRRSSFPS